MSFDFELHWIYFDFVYQTKQKKIWIIILFNRIDGFWILFLFFSGHHSFSVEKKTRWWSMNIETSQEKKNTISLFYRRQNDIEKKNKRMFCALMKWYKEYSSLTPISLSWSFSSTFFACILSEKIANEKNKIKTPNNRLRKLIRCCLSCLA